MQPPRASSGARNAGLLLAVVPLVAGGAAATGCHRSASGSGADAGAPATSADLAATVHGRSSVSPPPPPDAPRLGIRALQVNVFERPTGTSKKLGYLRLGALVARADKPSGTDGCPGGWYKVHPQGYVCAGDDATLDVRDPVVRAASLRPDMTKPMPYAYAFVRAVAPLYLKVPSKDEQLTAEFKLKEHLDWWREHGEESNRAVLGANDVAIDARGVPMPNVALGAAGTPSTSLPEGVLFGGKTANDPIPFWLEGGRQIPNVSGFVVPKYAVFANRVRRHTGLALVGSFPTGPESLDRRFAVTVDLRLVPTTKLKPDTGSPFHGVEVGPELPLPFAFVRGSCNADKIVEKRRCVHTFTLDGDKAHEGTRTLANRSVVLLSGKDRRVGGSLYRETKDGKWLKASDLGVVQKPDELPPAAKAGEKWIDISIDNQTLVLWEGMTPVYATLVSTGQDGMKDPKTTKSTIRGVFRIKNKHVTATMDSNERSSAGGGPAPAADATVSDREGRDRSTKGGGDAGGGRDAAYGKTVRRGQGTFELRDVPYVQYFEGAYALHAAYWHDVFGTARSHGCVNLSPVDAHRVFLWTDPPIPDGWHGVNAAPETGEGTTVSIHK